ncbi:MAG: putative toxin-antitoxin system toxin component, PIN family [Terracidiphilus sp.]|jgi:putative PIN family toxin of toxin-antitoxin system
MDSLSKTCVVLDSNIYVSAFLFAGKPLRVVQLAEEHQYRLLISDPIQTEVERVLAVKFAYSQTMIAASCKRIWKIAERIVPAIHIDLCRDPADNRILECAVAGDAHYIVTGDRDLLDMPQVFRFTILKVDAFLQRMQTGD